jgi:L-ribulose-5-phosphate 4-epimerase
MEVFMLEKAEYRVYPYRWVVLVSMIPILAMVNVFWLNFAPITGIAAEFYGVSSLDIAFLSMIYMIVYIILSMPASFLVDTKGFKASITVGAVLCSASGLLRAVFPNDFTMVMVSQIGAAAAQPFLVNSITKAAARWFPVNERATASGISTMAGYLGMIAAMILTPMLTDSFGMERMMLIYGVASCACAFIFIAFAREKPKTPPSMEQEVVSKAHFSDVKALIKKRDFSMLMVCMFIIMGIFNAVMTWVEDMLRPRGITPDQAGLIGGVLVIVGIIGAVVLPSISDKIRKRRPLLIWPILAALPGFAGVTFFSDYTLLLVSAALMGFFIMGMGPIAFQYGAEAAYPVPEGTSFGLLMLMGQISGIILIYVMDLLRSPSGAMTSSLTAFMVLIAISLLFAVRLKESAIIAGTGEKPKLPGDVERMKQLVCRSGRRLLEKGLVSGTWGNISIRVGSDYMAITPSGRAYEELTPEDIVIVNINDLSCDGSLKPSSEKNLHAEIYRSRSEIKAIIHTHSMNAGTVAASGREVPPILDDMVQIIGPSIRVAQYAVPGTKKLVRGAVRALAGRNGALLENHGAVCLGRDMEEAFVACEILEKACKAFIESEFLGGAKPINRVEAIVMHQYFLKKYSKQRTVGK